jgi:dolichyl-phosphate beta-glucosyltransferase
LAEFQPAERRITDSTRSTLPRLSIIIPAYNEARRLPPTLERLREYLASQQYDWEIIVVSNGSTDETDQVTRDAQLNVPELQLVSIPERGKGVAAKTGALVSRGDIVFLCDADLSMPAEQLDRFLARMPDVDVVAGSREAPGSQRYGEPWHRHVMGRLFNRLVQFVAVRGINDTQCGFKAFGRAAADDLFARQTVSGFGFDVELLYLARKLGYSVEELPIDWYFDRDTRVRPGIDSLDMFREVLLVRWRDVLGQYGPRKEVRESRA